jgi:hypothetical protein
MSQVYACAIPSSLTAPKLLSSWKEAVTMCSGGGSMVDRNVSMLELMLQDCMSHLRNKREREVQQQNIYEANICSINPESGQRRSSGTA